MASILFLSTLAREFERDSDGERQSEIVECGAQKSRCRTARVESNKQTEQHVSCLLFSVVPNVKDEKALTHTPTHTRMHRLTHACLHTLFNSFQKEFILNAQSSGRATQQQQQQCRATTTTK